MSVRGPAFAEPRVHAAFRAYPPVVRKHLLELRRMIFDTASKIEGVGVLQETLKWGQPSYLPAEAGSGTTIRIDRLSNEPDKYGLFVHCQTNLIATFRELYPRELEYRDNRCVVLDAKRKPPARVLRHCIALALTYRLKKRRQTKGRRPLKRVTPAAQASARSARRARSSP